MRLLILLLLMLTAAVFANEPAFAADAVQFDRDVRPILSDKCFFCHGPDRERREAGLRLDQEEEAEWVLGRGEPEESELLRRIVSTDAAEVMPPPDAHKKLSADEKQTLVRWVEQGARWSRHWSFVPPRRPTVPNVEMSVVNPIDAFVARRLKLQGLQFSQQADREKLIRRVTLDLTGLPPTLESIDAFKADTSADAYERVVDRLLESPHYGERMAVMWMDAARYGDTSVYHADGPRDMWGWRDTIVDAYNQNLPFDQFSIAQIAGDLLPQPTLQEQILAGFNRNNGTTDEGGAIAEEYRVEYVVDRVKTTSTVWLGLTMECAQCHDHKYDPISQEEYYRFYAFFNVSRDGGMQTRKGNAEPTLRIPDPAKQEQLPRVQAELERVRDRLDAVQANNDGKFSAWLKQRESEEAETDVRPSGCLASLPLTEGFGNSVTNLLAPDQAGRIEGNVEWVESRHDWALKFDGTGFVDLGDIADFERTDAFSYGGWVKPQNGASGALLARMDDGNAFRGFDMLVGDGPISVHLINIWPTNAIKVVTEKRLKPGQWHHVMATYDGSSQAEGVQVYVDGELWDWTIEQDRLSATIKTDKSLLIGSRHPGSRFKGMIDETEVYGRALDADEIKALAKAKPLRSLLAIDASARSEQQQEAIRRYYLSNEDPEYRALQQRIASLSAEIEKLKKPLTTVMVMGDMSSPRETFVLNRGAYDSPTDNKASAGTPSALPALTEGAPANRLGLARWLFREDHPLTARVAVNRYWQIFIGNGLVTTPEDFGAQGSFPSHPELLDWLAVDFRESGWDIKRFIKQLVMSRTYRLDSQADTQAYRADPQNHWLARGTRFRLQGEFLRDTALSLSGLLVDRPGGPGVKPYQPAGLWAEVGLGGKPKFVQDHGDDLYRRSLYTYWKRSAPPPAMQIFDAPTREKCTIRRARTNTPLQALVTLNDKQFVEASRHFAARMLSGGGKTTADRIAYGFRLATARRPTPAECEVLEGILETAMQRYEDDRESAEALLAVGESPRQETLPLAQHAAWTVVASSILNLDETLTRE